MRHLPATVTALVLAGASVASAAADLAGCTPLPVAVTARPVAGDEAQGLLFEIRARDLSPSYLFGTMHVTDADILNVDAAVSHALERSRTFVMEALFDDKSVADFSRMMFHDQNDSLQQKLTPALYQRMLNQLATRSIGTALAMRLKPWAAFMTLSAPPAARNLPLDLALMQRAQRHGLTLVGLETLREQAEALDRLTTDDQLGLLRDVICHEAIMASDLNEMKVLYRHKALGQLLASARKYANTGDDRYQHLLDALLEQRNDRMFKRMQPLLSAGGTFIAVGALHLAGPRGLLALIAQQGYHVTRKD